MSTQTKWRMSFNGKARSHHEKFWEKVDKSGDCWNWLGHIDKCGYGKFWNYLAHRFSWVDSFGEIPDGMYVCHKCDNPRCVNPDHLFLGTQKDNMDDMVKKGRHKYVKGEESHKSKLNKNDIYVIRSLVSQGYTHLEISKKFRVSISAIAHIVHGRSWSWVK